MTTVARSGSPSFARRERMHAAGHYMTGVLVLFKAIEKLEHPEGQWIPIALCALAGFAIIAATRFHHRLQKTFASAEVVVSAAEAIVCAAIGYWSLREGKQYLPWVFFFAAVLRGGAATWLAIHPRATRAEHE